MNQFPPPRAAYVHVPFCRHRCGYCNFTLIAGRDDLAGAYLEAIGRELALLGRPREVETLFFGGGTPTHLAAEKLARLMTLARRWFPPTAGAEISVEANPLDLTDGAKIEALRAAGVTRVSLGLQSFSDRKLTILERDHRRREIETAFAAARSFAESVSLDLIFGVPGETDEEWTADLSAALALAPDHISTYGLTFERGTQFWNRLQRAELTKTDEDSERRFYEAAIDTLTAAGFEHYEVSNFARPGFRCRHNEAYWLGRSYFAAGPGAARYIDGVREMNHRSTTTWLNRLLAVEPISPVAEREQLSAEDRARERLVFGLRRLEGVVRTPFAAETGFGIDALVGPVLRRLTAQGFFADDGERVSLTRRGLLVSDAIWPEFLRN